MVYILEAHPSDVWQMQSNIKDKVVFASPKNLDERAYTGWPDRIYVVDTNGRITYKSKPGPFGFKSDELAKALAQLPH